MFRGGGITAPFFIGAFPDPSLAAGISSSSRPKPGTRSPPRASAIAQTAAWVRVTTGFLNSRSQPANRRDGREVGARDHEGVDLRPVDAGEGGARLLRLELADRVRIGGRETVHHGDFESVPAAEVTPRPRVHLLGIGRDERDPARAERACSARPTDWAEVIAGTPAAALMRRVTVSS